MMDLGYFDEFTTEQIEWFKWVSDGMKENNGGVNPESFLFIHKPLPEYFIAFLNYLNNDESVEKIGDVYVNYSLSGSIQQGFFDIIKERNVTNVICGHQHGNAFTLKYEGVNLTFALKTGELGGYIENEVYLNGATYIMINDSTIINYIFVDRNKYKIYKK